ncbi:MAG: hypothetical protein LBC65_00105 [Oscillospiraceae bacterium]|jgi:hypothetical protein|nr:hypothetical protein [Oscillospiraceae bacterium]
MAASNGNCFVCGETTGKIAMKNHIIKKHGNGDEECCLIKAEGAYDKNYWLLFSVPLDAPMSSVDKFLRRIWCECCGHLSAFRYGGREFGKTRKVSALEIGSTLYYEYDFGSTTEILLTVVDKISRPKQREKVQLLARNVPLADICDNCGKPAAYVDAWERELLCAECAAKVDEDALLPVVNSPRCGECAYDGEQDIWTFDVSRLKQLQD